MLEHFHAIRDRHAFDAEGATLLVGSTGTQRVLVVVAREIIDDMCRAETTRYERLLWADRNRDALNRVASSKLAAGPVERYTRCGATLPLVRVDDDDLAASGETFADVAGRMTPAFGPLPHVIAMGALALLPVVTQVASTLDLHAVAISRGAPAAHLPAYGFGPMPAILPTDDHGPEGEHRTDPAVWIAATFVSGSSTSNTVLVGE